jgi:hypothetical protein
LAFGKVVKIRKEKGLLTRFIMKNARRQKNQIITHNDLLKRLKINKTKKSGRVLELVAEKKKEV